MSDVEEFGISETTDTSSSGDSEGVYANEEKAESEGVDLRSHRGDSADEVDPRKLLKSPESLSEIRWYYRETFAKILVDKPIDDAFKYGFEAEVENDDVDVENLLDAPSFEGDKDGFVGAHILTEKKARRDGFALLFIGTKERGSAGPHVSPISNDIEVTDVSHLKVLTIDDLTSSVPHDQIQEGTDLDEDQYEVRKTGLVVNTDVTSPDYKTPVGYVLDSGNRGQFIHIDRIIPYVWNREVDGDYSGDGVRRWSDRNSVLGQWEGDSVLIPSYHLIKGVTKGNWAIMQALYRGAAHVYSVKVPTSASDEEYKEANDALKNANAKSAYAWPDTEYEFEQHESGNQMEPREHFDVIFDQLCATHEMTRSVLFGTQTGTVSGSETDIKNYFNQIERYRNGRAEDKITTFLTRVKRMQDSRTNDDYELTVDFEWGPLFKVDRDTRIQMWQNASQAMTTLIGKYALTPDEGRAILSAEFTDIDVEDLSEDQMDVLDRVNLTGMGQGESAIRSEKEYTEGPASPSSRASQGGSQGGMQQGQTTGAENPASADSASQHLTENLSELADLHNDGVISEEEFEAAKQRVINE